MRYPPKRQDAEFLDTPGQDPREFAGLLAAVRRTNRWYGGYTLVTRYLERFVALLPRRPLTVLDVATASADVPAVMAAWARRRRVPLRVIALDRSPEILAAARGIVRPWPEIALVRGDALALPCPDRSVDIVTCALALHHFTFDAAARVLHEIARVARSGFVVNDVLRSWPAYLGALADVWLLSRNRLARHDGPLSVLRAFTWPEVHALAAAAGLRDVEIRRHRLQRVVLVRWPGGAVPDAPRGAR
ncbi:MAG: methyltransferase domain-containing protein [Armatimonadota bacterium]|nr:methyltransferase domain-containing protein [Armatimonadota bacterium]MDR7484967.1 methyltransferase domain-containing protein [Armatimonadota bacterium]MDR7533670.1 methyltransferase domain-containing protein [Armatimonadota bacterium]MDR7535481.1 methyltransferase domain-containing protein [Armatimonadota bacterium]